MKAKAKKLLSLIMAMAMCLSLMTTAFAAVTVPEFTRDKKVTSSKWGEDDKEGVLTVTYDDDTTETFKDDAVAVTENVSKDKATCKVEPHTTYAVKINDKTYTKPYTKGTKADKHAADSKIEWEKENVVGNTCVKEGYSVEKGKCPDCGQTVYKNQNSANSATAVMEENGEVKDDLKIVIDPDVSLHEWEYTFSDTKNVLTNDKGQVIFADGAVVTFDDVEEDNKEAKLTTVLDKKSEDGSFVITRTCKACGEKSHKTANIAHDTDFEDQDDPKEGDNTEDAKEKIKYQAGDNVLGFIKKAGDEPQDTLTMAKDEITKDNIVLKDCSKPGKYTATYLNQKGSAITLPEKRTVEAHHVHKEYKYEAVDSKQKDMLDSKTGKNKSCTTTVDYRKVDVCYNGHETKGNVETAPKAPHVPVGEKNEKDEKVATQFLDHTTDTATCKKAGTIDAYQKCQNCDQEIPGTRVTIESPKKVHGNLDATAEAVLPETVTEMKKNGFQYPKLPTTMEEKIAQKWTSKREITKEAGNHTAGSMNVITICQFGEEHERTTMAIEPKNKHTWKYDIVIGDSYKHQDAKPNNNTNDALTLLEKEAAKDHPNYKQVVRIVRTCQDPNCPYFNSTSVIGVVQSDESDFTTTGAYDVKQSGVTPDFVCKNGTKTYDVTIKNLKVSDDPEAPTELNTSIEYVYNSKVKSVDFTWDTDDYYWAPVFDLKDHDWDAGVVTDTVKNNKEIVNTVTYTCKVCGDTYKVYSRIPVATEDDQPTPVDPTAKTSISDAVIEGSAPYRGEYFNVPFTVTLDGKKLALNKDYVITNTQQNNFKGVGSHKITIEGIGSYTGVKSGKLYITETAQNVTVTPAKKTFTVKTLKKKAASFKISVKGAKGAVSYKSNNKKVTVSKAGKVTVKKGTKKGTYKVTVKVAKKGGFKAATKTVTIVVK